MTGQPCVVDTSSILSLGKADQLSLLLDASELELHITPLVLDELRSPETRDPVRRAIEHGRIQVTRITSDDAAEFEAIAEWSERVDPGEAEAIGLAVARGWRILLEDRAAEKLVARHGHADSCLSCVELLLLALERERLTVQEADEVFRSLDVYPGYEKRGISSVRQLR